MVIYTDGSAHPNPGPGGFGVIVYENNEIIHAYSKHFDKPVTNNRMELKAILYALIYYGKGNITPTVYSDSAYAVNTLTSWMYGWQHNGWLKKDNREPENLDLIQSYYNLLQQGYSIDLQKCDGHSGIEGNELADKLATGQINIDVVLKNNRKEKL